MALFPTAERLLKDYKIHKAPGKGALFYQVNKELIVQVSNYRQSGQASITFNHSTARSIHYFEINPAKCLTVRTSWLT